MPAARAALALEEQAARALHADRHGQTWHPCCHLVLKCEIAEGGIEACRIHSVRDERHQENASFSRALSVSTVTPAPFPPPGFP